jgi:hypothetical protein
MSNTIRPTDLADAIRRELEIYHEDVVEKVNAAGKEASKKLLKLTRDKAPKASGDFAKSLAVKEIDAGNGMKKFTLHARAPKHRVFHLLVHGHAKKNGGRVPGDPFLKNAVDSVLPEYEQAVEEAIRND